MKKLIFLILLYLSVINVSGQTNDKEISARNEIDLVLTDLLNNTFQLKYERSFGKSFSANIGFGYKNVDGIIRLPGLDYNDIKIDDIVYSGYKVIPEVRYYLNNQNNSQMTGFYFGAYAKFSSFKSDLIGSYTDDDELIYELIFETKIKITSLGLMVGYKLPLSKRFSLDFLIAGPGQANYKISFINKKDLPEQFYDDLNEALNQYSFFDFLNSDFRFREADRRSNFNIYSFRYSISVGYRF